MKLSKISLVVGVTLVFFGLTYAQLREKDIPVNISPELRTQIIKNATPATKEVQNLINETITIGFTEVLLAHPTYARSISRNLAETVLKLNASKGLMNVKIETLGVKILPDSLFACEFESRNMDGKESDWYSLFEITSGGVYVYPKIEWGRGGEIGLSGEGKVYVRDSTKARIGNRVYIFANNNWWDITGK